ATLQVGLVLVAFAAGRFQVEHQVLHVQSQLAEGLLHQGVDPTAATAVLDHLVHDRLKLQAVIIRQLRNQNRQLDQVLGKFVGGGGLIVDAVVGLAHVDLQVGCFSFSLDYLQRACHNRASI